MKIGLGTLTLSCPACAGKQFEHPADMDLDKQIRCTACGWGGPARDAVNKDAALRQAAQSLSLTPGKPPRR